MHDCVHVGLSEKRAVISARRRDAPSCKLAPRAAGGLVRCTGQTRPGSRGAPRSGSRNQSSRLVARLHGLRKVRRLPQTRWSECIVVPRYDIIRRAGGRRLARMVGARGLSEWALYGLSGYVMVATPPQHAHAGRPNAKSPPAPRGRLDTIERRRGTGGGMILHRASQLQTVHADGMAPCGGGVGSASGCSSGDRASVWPGQVTQPSPHSFLFRLHALHLLG